MSTINEYWNLVCSMLHQTAWEQQIILWCGSDWIFNVSKVVGYKNKSPYTPKIQENKLKRSMEVWQAESVLSATESDRVWFCLPRAHKKLLFSKQTWPDVDRCKEA